MHITLTMNMHERILNASKYGHEGDLELEGHGVVIPA
jgi:hypothetical protein